MGGGGGGILHTVSQAVTAIYAPIATYASVGLEAIGGENAEKVAKVPVVGTLVTGTAAGANLTENAVTAVATGDTSKLKSDYIESGKAAAVAGAFALGGAGADGAFSVGGGAAAAGLADQVAKKGIDVGTLSGAAASYFGNDLASYGIDVDSLFPTKPKTTANFGTGAGSYFQSPKEFAEDNTGSGITFMLGAGALLIFILAMRRKK